VKRGFRWALAAIVCAYGLSPAAETPPSVLVQEYFDALESQFEQVSTDRTVTLVELTPASRLFAKVLDANPSVVSLMRTNSKGVLINEYVRGRGAVRAYRSLANQRWYSEMKQHLSPHRAVVADHYGKSFLLWAQPIILASAVGGRRFSGVVVAKLDLLECFQAIALKSEYPFRILSGGTTLFSHRWESELEHDEAAVEVPGLSDVVIYEVRQSPPVNEVLVTEFDETQGDSESEGVRAFGSAAAQSPGARLPLGKIICAGLGAGLLLVFLRSRLRWRYVLRQVHEETAV
jgi:hypothetical protein